MQEKISTAFLSCGTYEFFLLGISWFVCFFMSILLESTCYFPRQRKHGDKKDKHGSKKQRRSSKEDSHKKKKKAKKSKEKKSRDKAKVKDIGGPKKLSHSDNFGRFGIIREVCAPSLENGENSWKVFVGSRVGGPDRFVLRLLSLTCFNACQLLCYIHVKLVYFVVSLL